MRFVVLLLGTIALCGCHGPGEACSLPPVSPCGACVCVETPCYCRPFDDYQTALAARHRAWSALSTQGGAHSCDYRRGFVQAHVDVAQGKSGVAPPIPPERYWGVCLRTECGYGRATEWYAGYNDGAAHALAALPAARGNIATSGAAYPPNHRAAYAADPCRCRSPGTSVAGGW